MDGRNNSKNFNCCCKKSLKSVTTKQITSKWDLMSPECNELWLRSGLKREKARVVEKVYRISNYERQLCDFNLYPSVSSNKAWSIFIEMKLSKNPTKNAFQVSSSKLEFVRESWIPLLLEREIFYVNYQM